MNKEELLNKYIDLIDKGYCSDCNELNCIDNFPHIKITHAIRELQQQCKKQKEVIDRILNETKETKNILDNNRDDNILSKSCLLSYLEIVEDLLKEVSE